MKLILKLVLMSALAMLVSSSVAAEHRYLEAFPPPGDGMDRYVIQLPHKERGEDNDFRVELIVGKEMLTDGVNLVRLGGTIEAKVLKGWGFTYYEVAEFGPAMSTLMGVQPGTPQVKQFISVPSKTINYNSRVPLVIYVPDGAQVRYRIWQASESTETAEEG